MSVTKLIKFVTTSVFGIVRRFVGVVARMGNRANLRQGAICFYF